MNIFLAGNDGGSPPYEFNKHSVPYRLQTYYEARKWKRSDLERVLDGAKMFFLDSGAFSFMNGRSIDGLDGYVDEYIRYINNNAIRYFFEVDVDVLIGVEKTRQIIEKIEYETGRKTIPVFHSARGLQAWKEMIEHYDYVAIGTSGLTSESKWARDERVMNQLISMAHKNGCKVHGLGFTRLSALNNDTVNFDSVDSTTWLLGARYATIYKFTGERMIQKRIKGKSPGRKILNEHNCREWVKFIRYKEN